MKRDLSKDVKKVTAVGVCITEKGISEEQQAQWPWGGILKEYKETNEARAIRDRKSCKMWGAKSHRAF